MAVNKTIQMVNIFDEKVTIDIGGTPGSGVTQYVIEPGKAQAFHENFCKPVPGAGSADIPSILERESTRTWPDGIRRPTLIPEDRAAKVKSDYAAIVDTWRKTQPKPAQQQGAGK